MSTDRNGELVHELNKQMRTMAPPAPTNAKITNGGPAQKLTQAQYQAQLQAACDRNDHFPHKIISKERKPNAN